MDLKLWEATGHPANAMAAALVRTGVSQEKIKPYLFTPEIVVARHVIPHSHPALTLNTHWVELPGAGCSTSYSTGSGIGGWQTIMR